MSRFDTHIFMSFSFQNTYNTTKKKEEAKKSAWYSRWRWLSPYCIQIKCPFLFCPRSLTAAVQMLPDDTQHDDRCSLCTLVFPGSRTKSARWRRKMAERAFHSLWHYRIICLNCIWRKRTCACILSRGLERAPESCLNNWRSYSYGGVLSYVQGCTRTLPSESRLTRCLINEMSECMQEPITG